MNPYATISGVEVFHGDCRDILPAVSWDVCLTDPPYSAGMMSSAATGFRETEQQYDSLAPELIPELGRLLSRTGRWVGVFSDVESIHLWRESLVVAGLEYIRTCAWVKPGAAPQFTGDRPAQGWEPITLCHRPGKKLWNGGGAPGVFQYPIPRVVQNRVFGQKPLALMARLVQWFSDAGEVVLDPFAGSGTTGVACLRQKRRCILVEVREEACEAIARRLEREDAQHEFPL